MSGPCVNDTSTVELLSVGGALEANLIVSPDGGNLIEARANGAFVGSGVTGPATGEIVSYAGLGALPQGWLPCDGSAVSRSLYADLFAVIGEAYGVGDGATTFNLPPPSRPNRLIGRQKMTADVTINNTITDTFEEAIQIVSVTAPTRGRPIRVRFRAHVKTDPGGVVYIGFYRDGVVFNRANIVDVAADSFTGPGYFDVEMDDPTLAVEAGALFEIRAWCSGARGNATLYVGADPPIQNIGPSFIEVYEADREMIRA